MTYTPLNFDEVDLTPKELEVLKRLRDVVAEKGYDYVYKPEGRKFAAPECVYFEYTLEEGVVIDQTPSCLVGHLAAELDWPISRDEEGENASTVISAVITGTEHAELLDSPVLDALNEAQDAQDRGKTWGEALQAFEGQLLIHKRIDQRAL